VFSGTDPWGNTYIIPDLNPYFASACDASYWGNPWPGGGTAGHYGGQMYSAPNMAILALPAPSAFVAPTNLTLYAGFDAAFMASVAGQAPVTVQWYEEPGTPLNGQTNLTLNLPNATTGESGNYYVVATNYMTGANARSADATLTVLADVGPTITNDIQAQTVFQHQTVQFTVGASGTPPLSYVWTFNGNPIPGATNSTLTLNDVSSGNVGNYQVTVSNAYGPPANSSSVGLGVTIPAWGTYPSAVMGSDLLLYCPLNESSVNSGVATNWGSLGPAYNGTYVGSANSSVAGPTNVNIANNTVVSLDGYDGYVQLPPLANVVVSNLTIAAWINDTYPNSGSGFGQVPNAAIFFQRSTYVFGLSVNPVASTNQADQLRGTWNGNFFDSLLVLPTNQWTLAAMVINPTNRALYLDYGSGVQSKNFAASNPSATFDGDSEIGWDTAGGSGGRLWQGPIGDVMIFDQAFSPEAIHALYLGVPPTATLTIAPSGANLKVTWPGGTLLEATSILGPWTPTAGATNGVYTFTPSGTAKFYRVQLQP
jgi:Concanavalin A-like lectin/glucanases superfamily/Immunoglobulin domain/Immunoglobulin I-set domain